MYFKICIFLLKIIYIDLKIILIANFYWKVHLIVWYGHVKVIINFICISKNIWVW